jgi:hypothetical protein
VLEILSLKELEALGKNMKDVSSKETIKQALESEAARLVKAGILAAESIKHIGPG